MTVIPATWNTYSISIPIDAGLVNQLMQFGFANRATGFASSGVFYDNVVWKKTAGVGVDDPLASAFAIRTAAPNPFRTSTRVDFSIARRGQADLSVYDVTGRLIATLFDGVAEAGPHAVTWDGRSADGRLAPSGVYQCTLRTAGGQRTRSLVLSR
jgi:hypothetical protein